MKRYPGILALIIGVLLCASCARMEIRQARYDAKQCPFCALSGGTCSYCTGKGKCSMCDGSGKRFTGAPKIEEEGIRKSSYTETCPYCKGSGVCRFCEGSKKCWACNGTSQAGDWQFYIRFAEHKTKELASILIPAEPELNTPPVKAPAAKPPAPKKKS
jgi:DnaJ-class molecular chaperone